MSRQLRGFEYVYCARHQKYGYTSKKEAKRARKTLHPGDHLDVYRCSYNPLTFHIEHLPYHVMRSITRRGEREAWHESRPTPLMMPRRVPAQRVGS